MNKNFTILAFCSLIFWVSTTLAENFGELNNTEQSGTFVQQKHLKILTQPFITEGKYNYSKETGLNWITTHPSRSQLNINAQGVFEISSDGDKKRLTNDDRFSQLLLAIFSDNQQQLLTQFSVKDHENETILVPLDEQVKALFKRISLTTQKGVVTQIKLVEPNDNSTVILLTPDNPTTTND